MTGTDRLRRGLLTAAIAAFAFAAGWGLRGLDRSAEVELAGETGPARPDRATAEDLNLEGEIVHAPVDDDRPPEQPRSQPVSTVTLDQPSIEKASQQLEGASGMRVTVRDPDGVSTDGVIVYWRDRPPGRSLSEAELEQDGARSSWQPDLFIPLPAGDYFIGARRRSESLTHMQLVTVSGGIEEVEIELDSIVDREHLEVDVRDPQGRPVTDRLMIFVTDRDGQLVATYSHVGPRQTILIIPAAGFEERLQELRENGGRIQVTHHRHGMQLQELPAGTRHVQVRFQEPLLLEVVLGELPGQQLPRNRLRVAIDGQYGVQELPDGTARFRVQPGWQTCMLILESPDGFSSLRLLTREVAVPSDRPIRLEVPPLHSLPIRGRGLRSIELRGDAGSWEVDRDPPADEVVIDHLPAGTYRVETWNGERFQRVTVEIPGPPLVLE